jgi:hypothetical protein
MANKVDVAINVYGKPYQTLAALKTLMMHCSRHIDNIYFILEKEQPYGHTRQDFNFIINSFNNITLFVPEYFLFISATDRERYRDTDYRYSLRYQYAWENTDKRYLYITHNDVIYKGDIIGEMLKTLHEYRDEYAGTGQVGACWACPAFFAEKCDGDRYLNYNPSYEEVLEVIEKYPPKRAFMEKPFSDYIDAKQPMPLPECRLNEWACLIDLEKIRNEVVPFGTTDPLGTYIGLDLGIAFFRGLTLRGYKFKNFDIYQYCKHGWGPIPGHNTLLAPYYYCLAEKEAEGFLFQQGLYQG